MHSHSVAIAIMISLAAASLPERAQACSCSPEPIYHALPKDGTGGVPRDIAPLLEGPFEQSSITFADEHGAKPKFTLNLGPRIDCLGGFAELIPDEPLAANTRYTITVVASYPDSLSSDQHTAAVSFTTGDTMLADETLRPPQLTTVSILRGGPDCIKNRAALTCIGGLERRSPRDHELIARRGDKILLRTTKFVQTDSAYGLDELPDCIELRRRAPDGRRSEPTKICGTELLIRDFQKSDETDSWVQCKGGILGDRKAYDDGYDAGVVSEPQPNPEPEPEPEPEPDSGSRDAGAPRDAATTSDAGSRNTDRTPAAPGCSVHSVRHSNLQMLPFACAVLLGALRRSYRRGR